MLKHPNFLALSGSAVKILLLMTTKHTGFNNRQIILSYDDMAEALHMSKGTAHRACQDLIYYGFIKIIKEGYFYGRQATEWEITFLFSKGYTPTNDWKNAKPRLRQRKKKPKVTTLMEDIQEAHQQKQNVGTTLEHMAC